MHGMLGTRNDTINRDIVRSRIPDPSIRSPRHLHNTNQGLEFLSDYPGLGHLPHSLAGLLHSRAVFPRPLSPVPVHKERGTPSAALARLRGFARRFRLLLSA